MRISVHGISAARTSAAIFTVGALSGIVAQYWWPLIGSTLATVVRSMILMLADLIR